jgi:hypothetical protein
MLLGCRVANYGVGGYGSDQALMLFRAQRGVDRAPAVILGHLSENLLRNLNQYQQLLYPGARNYFKPRYLLEGDRLVYVPSPVAAQGDIDALVRRPRRYLRHEAMLARPRRAFPYSWALVRWVAGDLHFRSRLGGYPRYLPFYAADHPAGGLQLTTRILATFAAEAKADGRQAYVLLIPTGGDFAYASGHGAWPDQPLADALRREGVRVIHAGPEMQRRMRGEDPCAFYAVCNGHFNARGYRLLAEVVRDGMRSPGVPGAPATP